MRIATFNLSQGWNRWDERRHLVLSQAADLRADVLCLNEVSIPEDSGRWLWQQLRQCGLDYAYLQQTKVNALSADEGQAILTLLPVVESGFLDYRACDRLAQVARLSAESGLIDVYVTHLHHVEAWDSIREYQVQRLVEWIDRRDPPAYRVVCGDFNATPEMASMRRMASRFAPTLSSPTFHTPLVEGHGDRRPDAESVPTGLTACLDYIWIEAATVVIASGHCFDKPSENDATLWPSDHLGVWADLEI